MRTIAIGDIHGCADALAALLTMITPAADDTIITLGDVIDRGPDSRGVLDRLTALADECRLIPLLGNHEQMFLRARENRSECLTWFSCGGMETLDSYGESSTWTDIPASHMRFLENCRPWYETEQFIFVHANYDPDVELAAQPEDLRLWLHLDEARARPHVSGKTVILGHTPQQDGQILDLGFLVCLDTFCYGGGWLTALDVSTGKIWQASQAGNSRESDAGFWRPVVPRG